MYRILIFGGYGVFGGRLARLLMRDPETEIYVAGRNRDRAAAFCETHSPDAPGGPLIPMEIADLTALASVLDRHRIDTLVNCIEPFQHLDYKIAETAIAAGVHYLDLADGRAFVAGCSKLSDGARDAGVIAASGASTLPALSSAVVNRLSGGLTQIDTIGMGIAPGLRMPRGIAVVRAVLGYAGKPMQVWREGRWVKDFGWQSLRRRSLRVGHRETGHRWLSLCDVPDLELFPQRYPGVRTVEFRAGLELAPLHFGLWAATWLVRGKLLRSLEPFARPMKWLADLFQPVGSDRGGMFVDVTGTDSGGVRITRTWTLVADSGHGPWIPVIPALIVARAIRDGEISRIGAYPCMDAFDLDSFDAAVANLDIVTDITERRTDG